MFLVEDGPVYSPFSVLQWTNTILLCVLYLPFSFEIIF
jgi:hypothetical protein